MQKDRNFFQLLFFIPPRFRLKRETDYPEKSVLLIHFLNLTDEIISWIGRVIRSLRLRISF